MAREKKLYEWDNDFRTFEEIKQLTGLADSTLYKHLQNGLTSLPSGRDSRFGKPKGKTIVAARVKPELPKPQKVNANCIVRVRHPELDSALNYLAKTTGKTYQAAFEEFVIYIFEGHLWGQESFSILKSRLAKHQNGASDSQELPMVEEKPRSRVAELLEPYIQELEARVADLQARNLKLENIVRQMRIFMQKAEDNHE